MLYGLKDAANFSVYRNKDDKCVLFADYCQTTTINFTADSVFAHNKSVNAIRWDNNRTGTFTTTTELFNMEWLALLFGSDVITGDALPFLEREVLTVGASGAVKLAKAPLTGTTPAVYKVTEKDLTDVSDPIAAEKVTVNGSDLTIADAVDGTRVAVVYMSGVKGKKFTVDNITFPGSYHMDGTFAIRDTYGVDDMCMFKILNAKPQSNVELTMDVNNVCQLSVTWDLMADGKGDMYEMTMVDPDQ